MNTETAYSLLAPLSNKNLVDVISKEDYNYLIEHNTDKGCVGRIIEHTIGLKFTSNRLDFKDGELKTFKCKINGMPKETIAITMINSDFDDLLFQKFEETHLYSKIKNMILIPMYKGSFSDIDNIKIFNVLHVKLFEEKYKKILNQIREDFYKIINEMKILLDNGKMLKTISGKYLQIRTKDSCDKNKKYHPIFSKTYNRVVSEKGRAFFFKKDFLIDILKEEV